MGTEILRVQDFLTKPVPDLFPRRFRPTLRSGHKSQRKVMAIGARRRQREVSPRTSKQQQQQNVMLEMGKVTILKRGQKLEGGAEANEEKGFTGGDEVVCGIGRLGPDPAMMPKQIRLVPCREFGQDGYAGSGFSMSPSPRSLPLPSFSRKGNAAVAVDQSATMGLRRLLRLE